MKQQVDCASVLKVLADHTRLAVLRALLAGPKHVGEINESIPITQTLLSHHLTVLRRARLVRAERDGKAVLYSLAPGVVVPRSRGALDLGCCRLLFDEHPIKKGSHGTRRRLPKRLPQGRGPRHGRGDGARPGRSRGRGR